MKTKVIQLITVILLLGTIPSCNKEDESINWSGDEGIVEDNISDLIIGSWEFIGDGAIYNEYAEQLTFSTNGDVSGRFKEIGENNYSNFTGSYQLHDKTLIILSTWEDGHKETWIFNILAINERSVSFAIEQGMNTAIVYYNRTYQINNN